jgi:hypothetical protein
MSDELIVKEVVLLWRREVEARVGVSGDAEVGSGEIRRLK